MPDLSRRWFLALLSSSPIIGNYFFYPSPPLIKVHIGDEFELVDGWILKKTDLREG